MSTTNSFLLTKTAHSTDPVNRYILDHSIRSTPEQLEMLEYVKTLPEMVQRWIGSMDEIQLFQLLIPLINAKRAIEIGTFIGYTSLSIALALPSDGQLITCDVTDKFVRQDIWSKAGVRDKIDFQLKPALELLECLLEKHGSNSFDFIFIDADKAHYPEIYELSIQLVRPNGLIAIDNTLWHGRVLDENDTTPETVAIRKVNEIVKNDSRVDISFLRLGDGTTLCRKK